MATIVVILPAEMATRKVELKKSKLLKVVVHL